MVTLAVNYGIMKSLVDFTDQELTALLKQRNHLAFSEIYKRYWTIMYTHALKMLKDEDDARDVVQELFTSLWIAGPDIALDLNLGGYLYRAVTNKVIDLIDHKKIKVNYIASFSSYIELHRNETLEAISAKELLSALEKEIKQLPPKMKAIFEMRVYQHLSNKEIADQLGTSDKTVKKQIGNAIKLIRPKFGGMSGVALIISILSEK